MNQRRTLPRPDPIVTPVEKWNQDVTWGRFTVTSDSEHVLCGVCRQAYQSPAAKAEHLHARHRARLRTVTDPLTGLLVYEWRLP